MALAAMQMHGPGHCCQPYCSIIATSCPNHTCCATYNHPAHTITHHAYNTCGTLAATHLKLAHLLTMHTHEMIIPMHLHPHRDSDCYCNMRYSCRTCMLSPARRADAVVDSPTAAAPAAHVAPPPSNR